jgi:hypothetical protein
VRLFFRLHFLIPHITIWAMSASGAAAIAAAQEKFGGEDPISVFEVIILAFHQFAGTHERLAKVSG